MTTRELRRSTRTRTAPAPAPTPNPLSIPSQSDQTPGVSDNAIEEATRARPVDDRHKAVRGDRYKVPTSEFFDDAEEGDVMYAVVTQRVRGSVRMWFLGGSSPTLYRGYLETWHQYFVAPDEYIDADEMSFQDVEMQAGIRERTLPKPRQMDADSDDDATSEEGAPCVVEEWNDDDIDDENVEEPEIDEEDANAFGGHELESMVWTNTGELTTDQRAVKNSMPEGIVPLFRLPNYRDEPLLNWFLFYFPVSTMRLICDATNENSKKIAWPRDRRWKHLRVGEFMRWLGLWILMTVYGSQAGHRRAYWGPLLNFGRYMPLNRFENILRAFRLPQYAKDDPAWGGDGAVAYADTRYDKFQETRKFTDMCRVLFQNAIKPGGWICIDECMFSWLGRMLKLPGWKVIKRKPHPFGLESKTAACSVTGMLVNYDFQEG